ncbi:hypothetical protein LUZ60_016144 [Juncus effusus]|nr:hypothetical protein LUZ60_016144 [Juncus effusus]
MSEANPNNRRHHHRKMHRRAGAGPPSSPSLNRRWKQRRKSPPPTSNILPRSASEPILRTVRFSSDGVKSEKKEEKDEKPPLIIIPTFYSCSDLYDSSPTQQLDSSEGKNKVVMSVTVEGSVGPIKALIRLGASVEETIENVLERYELEGRSPKLDPVDASSFQLHHSHFSLQSLNKSDKIGEVGGRSFYLRKNCELNNSDFGKEEICKRKGGEFGLSVSLNNLKTQAINPTQFFINFVVKKYNKIKRRSKRIWRVLTCYDWN